MANRSINFSNNQQTLQRDKKILTALLLVFFAFLGGVHESKQQLEQARAEQQKLQNTLIEVQNIKPAPLEKRLQNYWTESKADWAGLFSTLEEFKNSDITLLTVDPRLTEQRVLISGLAKDQETLNFYLTKLESSSALAQVELQRYRRTAHNPNGLEFFLTAKWIGHD